MKKEFKEHLDSILDIYRKVSPSIIKFDTEEDRVKFFSRRLNILKTLTLPKQLFRGKKLIDIGGGTGEKTLVYAKLGADVTIVEPNEKSCEFAKKLFAKFVPQIRLNIINKSIYDFEFSELRQFDIIICEGVLMITHDPIESLCKILGHLGDDAIVMVTMCESNGWKKRYLQTRLIRKLAGKDEKKILEAAKKYFQEHLDRAVKIGLRSEKTVIYDSYVIDHVKPVSLKEICNAFKKNNISYISSFPKLDLFYQTDSWSKKIEDLFNYQYYEKYYRFLEKVWMTSGEEDLKEDLSDFDFEKIKNRVDSDVQKLEELEEKIENGTFGDTDLDIIRKGYLGIGMNYFVGVKQKPVNPSSSKN